jgi:Protein of unknown function (DUF3037)
MKTAFSYTILRYVHDTVTGEFVNVGVALYAPEPRYASALCRTTYGRLTKTFPGMNGDGFRSLMRHIQGHIEQMGDQIREELPLIGLPGSVMEIAHAVLPLDGSSLQWSEPGGGLTEDPSKTLEGLFDRMVMSYEGVQQTPKRSDEEVWKKFKHTLETRNVARFLQPKKIVGTVDEVEFQHAWKNDVWHCLEPISFDLADSDGIRVKAHRWLGQLMSVKDARDPFKVYMLLGGPQQEELSDAFRKAVRILEQIPVEKEIVLEQNASQFSEQFSSEIEAHTKSKDQS